MRLGIEAGRLPESTGRNIGDILDRLRLREKGELLNAAVILFGKESLPGYPQRQLRLARFKGTDKSEFLDNRQPRGHAFALLDEAMTFLHRHLPISGRFETGRLERIDELLFPTAALREALVNALCHRDYSLPGGAVNAERRTPADAALVLRCNPLGLPTAKLGVGRVVDLAFSPYSSVLQDLETGPFSERNIVLACSLIADVRARGRELVRTGAGKVRGEISRGWTCAEVANFLDRLSYERHNPSREGNPAQASYRAPDPERAICQAFDPSNDPYQLAVYLRWWESRAASASPPPTFNIGIAYGEIMENCEPFDFPLLNRLVDDGGRLRGTWTGSSTYWRGDAFFDNPPSALVLAGSSYRMAGAAGLVLLYVIHRAAQGRQGIGSKRPNHAVTLGLVLPAGGPVFRRVTVAQSANSAI